MIIGAPKVHTCSRMMLPSAVRGSAIQPMPSMPTRARSWLTSPVVPKSCFQRMAMATEEPSSEGR